jgi:prophage tail gpP-like protein
VSDLTGRNDDVATGTDFGITNQPTPAPEPPVPPATTPVPEKEAPDLDPDEVAIVVGGVRVVGWKTVNITVSVETIPNHFSVTASEPYEDPSKCIFKPGTLDQATIYIGKDLLITGWIDRYDIITGAEQHDVLISGRGLCEDLVDCSADLLAPGLSGGQIAGPTGMLALANQLAGPFGIKVLMIPADVQQKIPAFQTALGETPYEIIERLARYGAYLVYENPSGNLVLDHVGTVEMASGFTMPGNVEGAHSTVSVDQRFSSYTVVPFTINTFNDISNVPFAWATVTDDTMLRKRPRIIVNPALSPLFNVSQATANWEWARRIGRSQQIQLTCDSWRDSNKTLWKCNNLAPINMPAHKLVNAKWIIGTVTFRKDLSGTHADVTLMPPDAFRPQPDPLQLVDYETYKAIQDREAKADAAAQATGGGGAGP